LQTQYTEECDDGNNDNADFCSAICKIEPAGSGGGGSSGGGSGGGGGSDTELGNTLISVTGLAYPGRTVNIILDSETVGSVKANNLGRFDFTTDASPGTASLGFWATDAQNTRSVTLNTTFDVTQGAVTNITGIILPPTIRVTNANINPGDIVVVSGQAVPNATIELQIGSSAPTNKTTSAGDGNWSISLNTSGLSPKEHLLKARSVSGTPPLLTQSSYSSALQLFVGVNGQATKPSDLNRDNKINLIDFSILIFWWGTNGGNSNPSADINGNGKVGIEDFSILLFNWTG
jgi:cysteine-rich repeat protein